MRPSVTFCGEEVRSHSLTFLIKTVVSSQHKVRQTESSYLAITVCDREAFYVAAFVSCG